MPSHDSAARRKVQSRQRQRGCFVYVPLEVLQKAKASLPEDGGPDLYYRTWAGSNSSVIVRFYNKP